MDFFKTRKTRFRYLRDRLFLVCIGLYFLNRFVIKPIMIGKTVFFSSYFNNLICVPFLLPAVLYVTRIIGLRGHDKPPDFLELSFYVTLWSFIFEYIAPLYGKYFNYPVGDPWDIVCYITGTAIAGFFWNFNITWQTEAESQLAEKY